MKLFLSLMLVPTIVAGCFSGYSEEPARDELRVRRAAFASEVIISGEVEAEKGEILTVPRMPSWQTAIKWIADEGTAVKAGDRVVELDNSALTAELESKRQSAMQTIQELQQKEAEWEADLEQRALDVEKKRSDLEKAKLDALVPRDLLSARAFEETQSALRRTTTEHDKALELLASRRTAVDAERRNLILQIDKAQREIKVAEDAISALVLRAPVDGILVLRDHPWEGRKMQTGDPVWVGFPIAMLPDFDSLRVKAQLADVDDGRIAPGMPATVTLDGYPGVPFSGRITSISAVAQESRRASLRRHFDVYVALDQLDPARMRPGLSARVVVRRVSQPSALLAPRAAIDFTGPAPRARMRSGAFRDVTLETCNAFDCVVTSGLAEGDALASVIEEESRG